jgi:hypothetical protein
MRGGQALVFLEQPVERKSGNFVILLAVLVGAEIRIGNLPDQRQPPAAVDAGHSLGPSLAQL